MSEIIRSACIIQFCTTSFTHTAKQNYTFYERDYMYRASVLYRFVLTAAQRQPSKTISYERDYIQRECIIQICTYSCTQPSKTTHFMREIMCRVCVLYRCVLPAAHRQPGHSGQSQQGGTRVHRVQAVLGQPRFGGHVGSRGPHQQPQRYGEVVLSGKRLNPNILLYEKSTCKTNLYHGNDCNQSSQDTIHSKRNIFRQFFFTLQHGPNRLLLVLLMG